jgi:hypothetical protein
MTPKLLAKGQIKRIKIGVRIWQMTCFDQKHAVSTLLRSHGPLPIPTKAFKYPILSPIYPIPIRPKALAPFIRPRESEDKLAERPIEVE